jgi:hypothetical protein
MITTTDFWFYRGQGVYADIIRGFTSEPLTHVCVVVKGCLYNTSKRIPSGWYTSETMDQPDVILRVTHRGYPAEALNILPVGTPYPHRRMVLWWASLCLLPQPVTCVSTALTVLSLGDIHLRARTPYELYSQVVRHPQAFQVPCGPKALGQDHDCVQQSHHQSVAHVSHGLQA